VRLLEVAFHGVGAGEGAVAGGASGAVGGDPVPGSQVVVQDAALHRAVRAQVARVAPPATLAADTQALKHHRHPLSYTHPPRTATRSVTLTLLASPQKPKEQSIEISLLLFTCDALKL
jgi:hypothetical protein